MKDSSEKIGVSAKGANCCFRNRDIFFYVTVIVAGEEETSPLTLATPRASHPSCVFCKPMEAVSTVSPCNPSVQRYRQELYQAGIYTVAGKKRARIFNIDCVYESSRLASRRGDKLFVARGVYIFSAIARFSRYFPRCCVPIRYYQTKKRSLLIFIKIHTNRGSLLRPKSHS